MDLKNLVERNHYLEENNKEYYDNEVKKDTEQQKFQKPAVQALNGDERQTKQLSSNSQQQLQANVNEIASLLRAVQGSISELSTKMGECTEAIRSLKEVQRREKFEDEKIYKTWYETRISGTVVGTFFNKKNAIEDTKKYNLPTDFVNYSGLWKKISENKDERLIAYSDGYDINYERPDKDLYEIRENIPIELVPQKQLSQHITKDLERYELFPKACRLL